MSRGLAAVLVVTAAACFPAYEVGPPSPADGGTQSDSSPPFESGAAKEAGGDAAPSSVTFVGSGQNFVNESTNGQKTTTVSLSVQPVAGDVLLAVVWCNDPTSTMSTPSGWGLRGTQVSPTGSNMWWYLRVAQSGEPSAFSLSCGGTDEIYAGIAVYRGAQSTQPVDAEYGPQLCDDTGECDASSIVTSRAGDRLVLLYALDGSDGTYSWNAPSGTTKRVDLGEVAIADGPTTSVGATGTQVAMHTNDSEYAGVDFVALGP